MYKSVIGKKFGRLLIEDEEKVSGRAMLKCLCDCGKRIVTRRDAVLSGKSKSCGCLQREKAKEVNYKHGYYKERLYNVWAGMKQRCGNPNHVAYNNYGGRGIKVCKEWSSNYVAFREFMLANGYDPEALLGSVL